MYALFVRFIIPSFILIFIFSCSGGYGAKTTPASVLDDHKKTNRLNDALMISAASQQLNADDSYTVGPQDLLEIYAYNVEELNREVRVNSRGEIALPLVGVLSVKGLTTSEIEQFLAKKLEKYLRERFVTVTVKEYKSQRISVIGSVNQPQIYSIAGQTRLVDMLMMAGGLSPDAGKICYIMRPSQDKNPSGSKETMIIDLDELLLNGNFALNIPVFAGDIINVPKGGVFYVDGAVRAPGTYRLQGRTTLMQALSMAKGVNKSIANMDDVRIFRDNGEGKRDVISADYGQIIEGQKPDVQITENDIIVVPVSGIKNFFHGFINTFRGAVSVGSSATMGF
jgi:polysaccharide export outer membrane protein